MIIDKFHFVRNLCKFYKYLTELYFEKVFKNYSGWYEKLLIMPVDTISRAYFSDKWQNKKSVTGKMFLIFDFCCHLPHRHSPAYHNS